MSDDLVTEDLCQARMATILTKLEQIDGNAREAREVGGKIMRRLFEGNGQSFASQVAAATKFCEEYEAEARVRATERRRMFWTWLGMGVGLAITIGKILFDAAQ